MATYSNAPPGESDRLPDECIEGVVPEPSELAMQDSHGLWQARQRLDRSMLTPMELTPA